MAQSHSSDNTRRPRQRWILLGAAAVLVVILAAAVIVLFQDDAADESVGVVAPTATPPVPSELAPDAVVDPAFPSLTYGIQAFLWWDEVSRAWDLEMMRLMNFTHVKQVFAWNDIQPLPDEWHWQQADAVVDEVECRGRELVVRLDGLPDWARVEPSDDPSQPPMNVDDWANYCGAVASRYQGRVAAYQVWNEPNLDREWGGQPPNAAGYVQVLQACSQAIHAADPDAVVISAGLAPTGGPLPGAVPDMDYLRQMYDAGASQWFDVLGLNAPGYKAPPEMSPEEAEAEFGHRWMAFRHVEDMRAIMVERGDAAKQIAILEMGWTLDTIHPSFAWHAVTEEQQADYLVGAYRWAAEHWRPWVGLMVMIYMTNPDWTPEDEEYWWAINTPGYPPTNRPAFFALANMEKVSGDTVIPARAPDDPAAVNFQPQAECPTEPTPGADP